MWTDESVTSTSDWTQLEPIGFGLSPFGSPSGGEFKIHDRGFGDPRTVWAEVTG